MFCSAIVNIQRRNITHHIICALFFANEQYFQLSLFVVGDKEGCYTVQILD